MAFQLNSVDSLASLLPGEQRNCSTCHQETVAVKRPGPEVCFL